MPAGELSQGGRFPGRVGTWLGMVLVFSHYLIEKKVFHAIIGAVAASATTACLPERFEPATSSASDNGSPRPRAPPSVRAPRPDVRLKTLRLRAAARVAAAG